MKKRQPTYNDVAHRAGVSLTTVSFVINGRMDVSIPDKTRARVMKAASEIGYRPNRLARGIVQGRTHSIGFILSRLSSSVMAGYLEGAQDACDEHNQRLVLTHTKNDPEREVQQIERLLENRVDGILAVANDATHTKLEPWITDVAKQGIPVVVIDDRSMEGRVDCVVSDDYQATKDAVNVFLKEGHKRIAYLLGSDILTSIKDRLRGYQDALVEAGIALDEALIVRDVMNVNLEDTLARWNSIKQPPTVVFTANDVISGRYLLGYRHVLQVAKLNAELVSYGHSQIAYYLGYSTISQNPIQMGHTALLRLLNRIESHTLPAEVIIVPATLIRA